MYGDNLEVTCNMLEDETKENHLVNEFNVSGIDDKLQNERQKNWNWLMNPTYLCYVERVRV